MGDKQRLKEARAEISALFGQSKGKGRQFCQERVKINTAQGV